MQAPEPGEIMRELLAKKQALQMELRQRAATGSSMYYGSRLAISLLTSRGATRVALAAGPGLLVMNNSNLYRISQNHPISFQTPLFLSILKQFFFNINI